MAVNVLKGTVICRVGCRIIAFKRIQYNQVNDSNNSVLEPHPLAPPVGECHRSMSPMILPSCLRIEGSSSKLWPSALCLKLFS